jgi:hypothetical protein
MLLDLLSARNTYARKTACDVCCLDGYCARFKVRESSGGHQNGTYVDICNVCLGAAMDISVDGVARKQS